MRERKGLLGSWSLTKEIEMVLCSSSLGSANLLRVVANNLVMERYTPPPLHTHRDVRTYWQKGGMDLVGKGFPYGEMEMFGV